MFSPRNNITCHLTNNAASLVRAFEIYFLTKTCFTENVLWFRALSGRRQAGPDISHFTLVELWGCSRIFIEYPRITAERRNPGLGFTEMIPALGLPQSTCVLLWLMTLLWAQHPHPCMQRDGIACLQCSHQLLVLIFSLTHLYKSEHWVLGSRLSH